MTTFVAKIRTTYADMDGLMLDCREDGLATDGSEWTNVAPPARPVHLGTQTGGNNRPTLTDANANWMDDVLVGRTVYNLTDGSQATITGNTTHQISGTLAGGVDNDWDTGDSYRVATPRFGNPYQTVVAQRPFIPPAGVYHQAEFTKANSSNFRIPLVDPVAASWWTCAFEYLTVASAGNDHPILYFPNMSVWRKNAAGNYKYRHGAVDVAGAGDMAAGTWLLCRTGVLSGALYRNGVSALAGTLSAQAIAAGDPAGYIGTDGAGNFCDVILRSMQIWNREVSPLEMDFAFQSLSCEFEYNQFTRANLGTGTWTDETGATPQEIPRINYTVYAPQRYKTGTFPAGGMARVQIAASVDGVVLPDSSLGGLLFDMHCEEYPSAGHPAVYQSGGWSAVWDVMINTAGHYTFVVHRQGSGSQVLHLDMEAV